MFKTKEEQVAEYLREKIVTGSYVRGEKLRQAEIAKSLGVSITPVREAIKILEAEGYLLGHSHRGSVVAPLDLTAAEENVALRIMLEGDLTRHAVEKMTKNDVIGLRRHHETFIAALRKSDRDLLRSANYHFHFHIYEIADRPQSLHFVRILWAKYPFDLYARFGPRHEHVIQEHEALIKKIEAGDEEGAVRAMVRHIGDGWHEFLEAQGDLQDLAAEAG